MSWDTGIAARIRAKGVVVVEVAGWQTRGSTSFDPVGTGNHHTAGPKYGTSPSLATCIYGRPDVPGPLCNVMQGRHPTNPMLDPAYVVAAGRANHGGKGAWRGVSGNSRFYGLEIEHTGLESVHPDRLEVAARIQAALLEGAGRDASWLWQHYEYALPRGRKIDFAKLAPWTADGFRARVAYWVGRTAGPSLPPEDDMPSVDDLLNGMAKALATPGHPLRHAVGEIVGGQVDDTDTIAEAVVDRWAADVDTPGAAARKALGEVVGGQVRVLRPFVAWSETGGAVYVVDGQRSTARLVTGWGAVEAEVEAGVVANGTMDWKGSTVPRPYTLPAEVLARLAGDEPAEPAEPVGP